MIVDVPRSHTGTASTVVGRTGAVLAVTSALVHTANLKGHGVDHVVIMVAMSVVCCLCAWHLWFQARS